EATGAAPEVEHAAAVENAQVVGNRPRDRLTRGGAEAARVVVDVGHAAAVVAKRHRAPAQALNRSSAFGESWRPIPGRSGTTTNPGPRAGGWVWGPCHQPRGSRIGGLGAAAGPGQGASMKRCEAPGWWYARQSSAARGYSGRRPCDPDPA